jgi:GDP/UDP-N,N'-diacetylbacillosamine 2-epimerase (hydrolysing)
MANADTHHKFFNKILNDYKRSNKNFNLFKSIKYLDYLILLKSCEFIIGNSSSGIIEAPTFSIPTVNVGLRQDGRLRSSSVFDTSENKSSIYRAIKLALNFNNNKKIVRNPYDYGDTVSKILTILKNRQTYKNKKQFSFQNFKF